MTWRLADGRGGHAELCSGAACVPWVRAAIDGRLVVADLDGDGAREVVRGDGQAGGAQGELAGWRARGGRFEAAWTVSGAPGERLGHHVALAGDLDGDGKPELVALAAGGPPPASGEAREPRPTPPRLVAIAGAAAGAPVRTEIATLAGWSNDLALATGDVDGDGALDVAIAGLDTRSEHGEGRVEIRRGQAGAIAAAPAWTHAIEAAAIVLVDDDRDGHADLWWADRASGPGALVRWRGGAGGLDERSAVTRAEPAPAAASSWFAARVVAGAFTRAGEPELAVTAHGARRVYVYRPPALAPDRVVDLAPRRLAGQDAAAIDLDGDGVDELVILEDGALAVFPGAR